MRLGAIQMFVADKLEVNLDTILRIMTEAAYKNVDLLTFPEMSLTGYNPDVLNKSDIQEETTRALDQIALRAADLDLGVIVGHAHWTNDDQLLNAATVLLPDKTRHTYYKTYVTEAEAEYFNSGTEPLAFTYNGHRFGVIICRDQNYPELARRTCRNGVAALFILSAHYYHPHEARWKIDKNKALPIARAVENKVHVLMANTVGSHIGLISLGNSLIADPEGALVALADEASEVILTCDFPESLPKPGIN